MWTSTIPWKMWASCWASCSRKRWATARASIARDISCCPWMKRWRWWRWIWAAGPALVYKDRVKVRLVGDLQTELVEDFFGGFVNHAGANLHAKVLYGRSNHHKIEAIFKCFARAMKYACSKDARLKDNCLPPRGCYDRDSRLRRGQSAVGAEHARSDRLRVLAGARCGWAAQAHRRLCCRAWAISAR